MNRFQSVFLIGAGIVSSASIAAAQGTTRRIGEPIGYSDGERFMLAILNALVAGGLFYMIFRLIVGFQFRNSKRKPHSLAGLAWVIGAHFLSFGVIGVIGGGDVALGGMCFLLSSPVAMLFIYATLNQARQDEMTSQGTREARGEPQTNGSSGVNLSVPNK